MKTFAVMSYSDQEVGMIFTVSNRNFKKAVKLSMIGLGAWFAYDKPNEIIEQYFDGDYGFIETSGWAEPAMRLMDNAKIKYTLAEEKWVDCFDEEFNPIEKYKDIPIFEA